MAQPLKYDELVQFKKNCDLRNISIKVFPQNSTPKARKLANVSEDDKSDEADTRAIANFLLHDSKAFNALKDFHPTKMEDFQKKSSFVFTYLILIAGSSLILSFNQSTSIRCVRAICLS